MTNPEIFRAYDIRGIFGRDFDVEDALNVGRGFATFLKSAGDTVVVGRDGRLSSPLVAKAVIAGILSCGKNVLDVGIISTPGLCFATARTPKACGGLMVSASHNPLEYNGFKTKKSDGCGFVGEDLEGLYEIIQSKKFAEIKHSNDSGTYKFDDTVHEEFISHLVSRVAPSRKFKVVIDVVNGTGGALVEVMKRLGHEVIALNNVVDGTFPAHAPEPRPDTIGELVDEVKKQNADFGVCLDGDADRGVFVDDLGRVVRSDIITAILARYYLKNSPGGKIIATVNLSQHLERLVNDFGGELVWSRVGSVFIDNTFKKEKALVGGEASSHAWLHDFYPFSDGQHMVAKMTEVLDDIPLSALVDGMGFGKLFVQRITCPEPKKDSTMLKLAEDLSARGKLITIDGLKLILDESSWILIRRSNTEPILKLTVEAATEDAAQKLALEYEALILKLIQQE